MILCTVSSVGKYKYALIADDRFSEEELARIGKRKQVLQVRLKQARNPAFHRLAHALGQLVVENIPTFEHLTAHRALKRLQYESDVGCEHVVVIDDDGVERDVRYPRSLAYESMDQLEFEQVIRGICQHISDIYWPESTATEIEDMIEDMARA